MHKDIWIPNDETRRYSMHAASCRKPTMDEHKYRDTLIQNNHCQTIPHFYFLFKNGNIEAWHKISKEWALKMTTPPHVH